MYKGKKEEKKKRAMKLKDREMGEVENTTYGKGRGNLDVALHYGCHPSNPSAPSCKVPPGKKGGVC